MDISFGRGLGDPGASLEGLRFSANPKRRPLDYCVRARIRRRRKPAMMSRSIAQGKARSYQSDPDRADMVPRLASIVCAPGRRNEFVPTLTRRLIGLDYNSSCAPPRTLWWHPRRRPQLNPGTRRMVAVDRGCTDGRAAPVAPACG